MDVAIVSDQPTPYRLQVLRRLAREIPQARFHNFFTHRLGDTTHDWRLAHTQADHAELRVWFEPEFALPYNRFFTRRGLSLHRRLRSEMERIGVKLVILNGYADVTRALLIRWAKARRIPLLLAGDSNIHAPPAHPPGKAFAKAMYLRWVLRNVAGLMPMGTAGRAYFRAICEHHLPEFLFPYEPDYGLFSGPDPARVAALRETHRLTRERKRFLFVGRVVPAKGVDVLCDAFEKIAATLPEWDVVIVGGGDGALALPARWNDAAGLRERVVLVPFAPAEEVAAWMACCDVFVLPSRFEPWGVVINEAVAAGLPVIATKVCGAAIELVHPNENGLLVPPGDADALARAMLALADDATRNRMRAAAGDALARWRSQADPVEAMRAVLEQMCRGDRSGVF